MQLAQQTIVVVMMVVFSSTLLMSAGLVVALRASEAGRQWALGHVVASAAGLLVVACTAGYDLLHPGYPQHGIPPPGALQLSALGAGCYILGRLTIYRGVRTFYGLPPHTVPLRLFGLVVVTLLVIATGLSDARLLVHALAYGVLAMVSFSTIVIMLRSDRGRTGIGGPVVMVSHLVLLAGQVVALTSFASPISGGGAAVTPFFMQPSGMAWPLLSMIAAMMAVLLGLFGFCMMATEQIIALNENGARVDALTGLLNRGALDQSAASLIARWQRDGEALSCLVIDVDHFKQVNDTFGHDAGDGILREIAAALDHSRRASDIAARYGGEEFCILCPHTDELQATALANRILRKVRAIPLPGRERYASVSIGVAQLRAATGARDVIWRGLFAEADRALYSAKERGRDQFVIASRVMDEVPVTSSDTDTMLPLREPDPLPISV
ncbi:GGDEF domain-containing protein [Cupriavidus pauculus]|uniref:diguanylate cyclase n=1 Tax=Cupriavidus pauculus TaxID=82633 RepID=A0A5P2HCJ9_9BURK|nr:GGDEF domain-containing protein [Cupriavidus pauculus]QET05987.1 GGDEF domain-containing protein [Cupriavidus pauculus]